MNNEKWVEIARTGTFTDTHGREKTFTRQDLDAIARAYDPKKRDAPLVFGHPALNAPAYGWAEKLKSENGRLFATFAQVPGEVKEIVRKGHYRHVSMSLMPDGVTLRHVGLLGAAQPAIDGLAPVELASGEDCITVDFAAAVATKKATDAGDAAENQGDHMTAEELEKQVAVLTAQLESAKKELDAAKSAKDGAERARTDAEKGKEEAEKKAEKATADFAAFREEVEKDRRERRVTALIEAGKVKPAEKASVLNFAAALAKTETPIEFAAGDGKTESITLEERYWRELEERPADSRFADFSAPPAHTGNPSGEVLGFSEVTSKL